MAPIALQLAVLTSKIARLDCPREWPELIPTLLEAVKQPEQLHQQRALLTLHHVTKTLASKRLLPDRKLFREVSEWLCSVSLSSGSDISTRAQLLSECTHSLFLCAQFHLARVIYHYVWQISVRHCQEIVRRSIVYDLFQEFDGKVILMKDMFCRFFL